MSEGGYIIGRDEHKDTEADIASAFEDIEIHSRNLERIRRVGRFSQPIGRLASQAIDEVRGRVDQYWEWCENNPTFPMRVGDEWEPPKDEDN